MITKQPQKLYTIYGSVCDVPLHTKLHMPNKFISSTQRKKNKSIFCTTTKADALHYTKTKKSLKFHTFSYLLLHQISETIITYYSYYYHLRSSRSHHVGITDGTKLSCAEMEFNVVPHSKLPEQKTSTVHFNSYCPIVSLWGHPASC